MTATICHQCCALFDGNGNVCQTCAATPRKRETMLLNGINILMDESALGVMGPRDNRTMVRRATNGKFVVMTVAAPHRVIKTFDDAMHARHYNAKIHGERL